MILAWASPFNIKMGALWKKIVKKMFCSVYVGGVYEV